MDSDIISTLVNIYGSQDQFLEEYRNMLSERVLNSKEFDLDNEIQNKELLELRFGKNSLHYCDVMLKDIQNSKRSIKHYKEETNDEKENTFSDDNLLSTENMNCITISKEYWNIAEDVSQFKFPYTIQDPFESYAKKYAELNKLSEINYLSNLGHVELTLTFDNGSFKFNVSPIQAAIISLFDDSEDKFSDEILAEKLSITTSQLREQISYWVLKGVVIEEHVRSRIQEYLNKQNPNGNQSGLATVYSTPKVLKEDSNMI